MCKKSWWGWIPTNLGELNFELIGYNTNSLNYITKRTNNIIKMKRINLNFISDSFISKKSNLSKFRIKKLLNNVHENYLIGEITLTKCENNIIGDSVIIYENSFATKTKFKIDYNGKIKIYELYTDKNEYEIYPEFEDDLASIFYILIKSVIHGDNHHHQKIDTALCLTKNYFNEEDILNSLLNHIKRLEYDIKTIDKCFGKLKVINSENEVDGYKAYINTFIKLFINTNNENELNNILKIKIETVDNVILSLKANVKKTKDKYNFNKDVVTTSMTFIAFIISFNILLNGFYPKNNIDLSEVSRISLLINSIFLIFLIYYYIFKCYILNLIFYKDYYLYEFFYHLDYYKPNKRSLKFLKFIFSNILSLTFLFIAIFNISLYLYKKIFF